MGRVIALDLDGKGDSKVSDTTIETLFWISLTIDPRHITPGVKDAVREIGRRVVSLESETGQWVRRESRLAQWEAMRSA